jgi:uncharacterized protein (TIGR03067 family)
MRVQLLAVLAVGLLVAAEAPKDDAKNDLKKMEGSWKMVAGETDGNKVEEGDLKSSSLKIKGDKYEARLGDSTHEGKLTLGASKKLKTMDATDGDNTVKGIYELKGDELKICIAPPGQDRPTEFGAKAGSGHIFMVWKREKKSE